LWAFGALLVGGLLLRIYAVVGYWPAVLFEHDTAGYVYAARHNPALNLVEPAGYAVFLRFVHELSSQLAVTVIVQHALGLLAGLLLYLTARRLGASRWVSLVPAGVVWLNGDQLFLEHALMSDALFTFVLAATLYAAVRCLEEASRPGWPLAAGALAGLLPTVRSVGLLLVPLLVIWLAVATGYHHETVYRVAA
jgi:hypothetical protein